MQWNACCTAGAWFQNPLSSRQPLSSATPPDPLVPALLHLTRASLNFKVRLHAVNGLQALQLRHGCGQALLLEIFEQLQHLAGHSDGSHAADPDPHDDLPSPGEDIPTSATAVLP